MRAAARTSRPCSAVVTQDRKSTRLNSSHLVISYAAFCLKKKQDGPICVQGHLDVLAEAAHRLVDRVIKYLVDEAVEAACNDLTAGHRRAISNRLQAFDDP